MGGESRTRTITNRGTVHAEWRRVVEWWSDPSGELEWRQEMEQSTKASISWREYDEQGRRVVEGRWTTPRGSDVTYKVTKALAPPLDNVATASEYVRSKDVLIEERSPNNRCRTSAATLVETIRPVGGCAEVLSRYSWRSEDERWWDRVLPPISFAVVEKRRLRGLIRQCERERSEGWVRTGEGSTT